LVNGRVQGVWYRKFVREKAQKADFKGYVKNLPDGKVEAVANVENEERFKEFVNILKEGSPYSIVKNVEWEEIPYIEFENFDIKY
jgi:acylphosphatase